MTEIEIIKNDLGEQKMSEVLNLLISSRILLSFHHYVPHNTSSVTSSASRNLMERQCKK
jgi:hypothetical protein